MKDQQVGHYKILEKLGAGGMGEVWLAEDTRLERKVALKFLPHFTAQDESEKARFYQEAKVAARLKHQNIAQVYEIGEDEDRLFIVMEYVEGGSLRDRLDRAKGRSLPLEDVLYWIQQTADGLGEAHRQGIIHRDIKPDNLMLSESGQIKITDFGLARFESATRLTAAGATLGTVNYMSPEQVTGKDVDHRSDLFALGATGYELLTGQQVFSGADANATYFAILNNAVDPLSRFMSSVPKGLEVLISKLLEKDPYLRYQSAAEVTTDIRRLIGPSAASRPLYRPQQKLRDRLKTLSTETRVILWLMLPTLFILTQPGVTSYRRVIQDGVFSGNSRLASLFKVTDERVQRGLHTLKRAGLVDAYVASALLTQDENELSDAIKRSPTNAALYALRAEFRFFQHGPADSVALEYIGRARQLDPENGVYYLLEFIQAQAVGDQLRSEEMVRRAVEAEEFRFGWTDVYYGAVYRCLVALDLLHPNWQNHVPRPDWHTYRATLAFVGQMSDRGSNTMQRWEGSNEDLRERGILVERLGNRLLSDETGSYFQSWEGRRLIQTGIDAQIRTLPAESSEIRVLEDRLELVLHLYSTIGDNLRERSNLMFSTVVFFGMVSLGLVAFGLLLLVLTIVIRSVDNRLIQPFIESRAKDSWIQINHTKNTLVLYLLIISSFITLLVAPAFALTLLVASILVFVGLYSQLLDSVKVKISIYFSILVLFAGYLSLISGDLLISDIPVFFIIGLLLYWASRTMKPPQNLEMIWSRTIIIISVIVFLGVVLLGIQAAFLGSELRLMMRTPSAQMLETGLLFPIS